MTAFGYRLLAQAVPGKNEFAVMVPTPLDQRLDGNALPPSAPRDGKRLLVGCRLDLSEQDEVARRRLQSPEDAWFVLPVVVIQVKDRS